MTRRGRRLVDLVAVWVGWILGGTLVMVSAFWEVMPIRLAGFVMLFAVATFTGVRAVNRRDAVIAAAFEMGRSTERDDGVTPLH